jgi:hypothetical protein
MLKDCKPWKEKVENMVNCSLRREIIGIDHYCQHFGWL